MWPIDHFAELLTQLDSQFELQYVLCGSQDDRALCERLMHDPRLNNLTNLAGQTSLLELVELVRSAALVVTNDSSPVHIAAATNTPSVCILGGGHYGRFLPYHVESDVSSALPATLTTPMECFGCNWSCSFLKDTVSTVPCIANVSPTDVMQSCTALLKLRTEIDS
jgi:ADP-heptose:LPS heptosyltransferase